LDLYQICKRVSSNVLFCFFQTIFFLFWKIKTIFTNSRAVFAVEEKSHAGHMKAMNQNILDGTSKWSAKIAITGLQHLNKQKNVPKFKKKSI
jgi:hypothetical protein